MATNINYEYLNETSIDPQLICSICSAPYHDPLCTPCAHIFCRGCITRRIDRGNLSCPICRGPVESKNCIVEANRDVCKMLGRLRVKCVLCEECMYSSGQNYKTTIQR